VLALFALSVALMIAWWWVESRSDSPLVDMRMMQIRAVWMTNATALVFGFGMFASFVLVPEFVELPRATGFGFGASVTQAGIYMLPSTVGMLAAGPVAGRLAASSGSRLPLQVGAVVTCAAFVLLAAAHARASEIYTAMLVMGIGFAFGSMANLIVESVPPEQTGVATGMNTIVRTIGGAIGSQVAASIIAATLAVNGLPSERGFTIAFAVSGAALALAAVITLLIPSRTTVTAVSPWREARSER
jgi:MFS family permease